MASARLSNDRQYSSFSVGEKTIRFVTSPYLERYTKIKEWDNGYIVVLAKYDTMAQEVEDYIDLIPILENLYINPQEFLKSVKEVKLAYD